MKELTGLGDRLDMMIDETREAKDYFKVLITIAGI